MSQTEKAKKAVSKVSVRHMSQEVAEVRKNINIIQEAMQATFKKDTHYGVIPGCQKPSLYKAGAETLIALFKLTFRPETLPVDTQSGEVRYLIRMDLLTRDGVLVGSGIGECSSLEEKYAWRAAICEEEFECTPETHRRIKFRKNKYRNGEIEKVQQVRVSSSDMANTILKMAKKRALIDAVLTATAASDIFTQDIQDLPEGYIAPDEVIDAPAKSEEAPTNSPQEEAVKQAESSVQFISEAQRKRLYAIAMGAGMTKDQFKEWLMFNYDIESSKDILRSQYDQICREAEVWR